MQPHLLPNCFVKTILLTSVIVAAFAQGSTAHADTWALLVGVEKYESTDIAPLSYSVADVKGVANALEQDLNVPVDHIRLMTSDLALDDALYPTNINVLRQLGLLPNRVKPDDTFILFFSGHGYQRPEGDFLATVNAAPFSIETLRASTLGLDILSDALKRVPARSKVFIVDACRNDPERSKGASDNAMTGDFSRQLKSLEIVSTDGPTIAATARLLSCQEGQRSWEEPTLGHGVFTYFLLKGLEGDAADKDGSISAYGVCAYVQKNVRDWSRDHLAPEKQQVPDFDLKGGTIELGRTQPRAETVDVESILTTATLQLTTEPPGAKIFIEGTEQVGKVTPCKITIDLGVAKSQNVEVALAQAGYLTKVQSVRLMRGHLAAVEVTLPPIPKDGDNNVVLGSSPSTHAALPVLPVAQVESYRHMNYSGSLQCGDPITTLKFSPDGTVLAGATNGRVRTWGVQDGATHDLPQEGWVTDIAFSPDSATLASSSINNTVKLWSVRTSELQRTLTGHKSSCRAVTFSHDGHLIASGDDSGVVDIWDVPSGNLVKTFQCDYSLIRLCFSTADDVLMAFGATPDQDDNQHRFYTAALVSWNVATGNLIGVVGQRAEVNPNSAITCDFSIDGKWLISSLKIEDGIGVGLWNTGNGIITCPERIGTPDAVAFAPNQQIIAYGGGGYEGNVSLINLGAINEDFRVGNPPRPNYGQSTVGGRTRTFVQQADPHLKCLNFSTDGTILAGGYDTGTVRIWHTGY